MNEPKTRTMFSWSYCHSERFGKRVVKSLKNNAEIIV